MPHCQICLSPVPDHAPDCPVATGEPVRGGEPSLQQLAGYHHQRHGQPAFQGQDGYFVLNKTDHLRIEALEKELALLRARIAKLERQDAY